MALLLSLSFFFSLARERKRKKRREKEEKAKRERGKNEERKRKNVEERQLRQGRRKERKRRKRVTKEKKERKRRKISTHHQCLLSLPVDDIRWQSEWFLSHHFLVSWLNWMILFKTFPAWLWFESKKEKKREKKEKRGREKEGKNNKKRERKCWKWKYFSFEKMRIFWLIDERADQITHQMNEQTSEEERKWMRGKMKERKWIEKKERKTTCWKTCPNDSKEWNANMKWIEWLSQHEYIFDWMTFRYEIFLSLLSINKWERKKWRRKKKRKEREKTGKFSASKSTIRKVTGEREGKEEDDDEKYQVSVTDGFHPFHPLFVHLTLCPILSPSLFLILSLTLSLTLSPSLHPIVHSIHFSPSGHSSYDSNEWRNGHQSGIGWGWGGWRRWGWRGWRRWGWRGWRRWGWRGWRRWGWRGWRRRGWNIAFFIPFNPDCLIHPSLYFSLLPSLSLSLSLSYSCLSLWVSPLNLPLSHWIVYQVKRVKRNQMDWNVLIKGLSPLLTLSLSLFLTLRETIFFPDHGHVYTDGQESVLRERERKKGERERRDRKISEKEKGKKKESEREIDRERESEHIPRVESGSRIKGKNFWIGIERERESREGEEEKERKRKKEKERKKKKGERGKWTKVDELKGWREREMCVICWIIQAVQLALIQHFISWSHSLFIPSSSHFFIHSQQRERERKKKGERKNPVGWYNKSEGQKVREVRTYCVRREREERETEQRKKREKRKRELVEKVRVDSSILHLHNFYFPLSSFFLIIFLSLSHSFTH